MRSGGPSASRDGRPSASERAEVPATDRTRFAPPFLDDRAGPDGRAVRRFEQLSPPGGREHHEDVAAFSGALVDRALGWGRSQRSREINMNKLLVASFALALISSTAAYADGGCFGCGNGNGNGNVGIGNGNGNGNGNSGALSGNGNGNFNFGLGNGNDNGNGNKGVLNGNLNGNFNFGAFDGNGNGNLNGASSHHPHPD